MNILYITPKIPYPLSDGGKLRAFHHIKHFSKKHRVISLSTIQSARELNKISELKKYCRVESVILTKFHSYFFSFFGLFSNLPLRVWYFKSSNFRKKLDEILSNNKIDLVFIQAERMVQYAPENLPVVVDIVDTSSLQISRALKYEKNFLWKFLWALECPRMRNYEKQIVATFGMVLVASQDDKNALGGQKNIFVLKNGVNASKRLKIQLNAGKNILFIGNMEYPPNSDAANYFAKEILPIIKSEIPDAKFFIVGKNPPNRIRKLANNDVVVTGEVPSIEEYISMCQVFVAPMRLGSGQQNKVLEAMAFGMPVIASLIANAGINARDNKEILIADTSQDFANKTIRLLKDKSLSHKLAKNSNLFVKKRYAWNGIYSFLDELII